MKYYFKVGQNTRILYPGDFFIGLDNTNHTYEELDNMGKLDREIIGVFDFNEDTIYAYEDFPHSLVTAQITEFRDVGILNQFMFRGDYYSCTTKDLAIINTLLTLSRDSTVSDLADIGNMHWFNETVPFFWVDVNGRIRNMDLVTFKEFAKNAVMHVLSYNLAAEIFKAKHNAGEEIDLSDENNWPLSHTLSDPTVEYVKFASRLIETHYGEVNVIDDEYQNQIDNIASMIE